MKGMLCLYEKKITSHSTRHTFKQKAESARGCFTVLNTAQKLYKKVNS